VAGKEGKAEKGHVKEKLGLYSEKGKKLALFVPNLLLSNERGGKCKKASYLGPGGASPPLFPRVRPWPSLPGGATDSLASERGLGVPGEGQLFSLPRGRYRRKNMT